MASAAINSCRRNPGHQPADASVEIEGVWGESMTMGGNVQIRIKCVARAYGSLVFVNYMLNLGWEMAHQSLYANMPPFLQHLPYLAIASAGDLGICLGVVLLGSLFYRRWVWFDAFNAGKTLFIITISAAISAGVEYLNVVILNRWAYTDAMPLIPGIGIGLSPFLQITLLPFISAFLAGWRIGRGKR